MGPDHVSNIVEGIFTGTSASSPHVAGAAALILELILDKNPGISVDDLRKSLRESLTLTAINMGSPIPNNIYGYGRLSLDPNAAIDYYNAGYDGSGIKVAVIDVGFADPSSALTTSSGTSGGGGGGGCFIATAAYGSYEAPYVKILRKMRDRFLLTNAAGKAFVNLYYTYSPPIADIIANHHRLKIAVRIGLLPLVGISWLALKTGVLFTFFTLTILTLLMIGLIRFVYFRMFHKRNKTMSCP
jgi:subtilisin family serine protease